MSEIKNKSFNSIHLFYLWKLCVELSLIFAVFYLCYKIDILISIYDKSLKESDYVYSGKLFNISNYINYEDIKKAELL